MSWLLLDLARQVRNKLGVRFGGTGNARGWGTGIIVAGSNRSGSSIPLYTLVRGGRSDTIELTTVAAELTVLGVVVGYFDTDGAIIEADVADDALAAVLTSGRTQVLAATNVSRGQYAFASDTDGQADAADDPDTGMFGRFMAQAGSGSPVDVYLFGSVGGSSGGGGGGAPTSVDYLVGTASGSLSAEIVAGTTPGGELGGTWASPTVDTTHSGSAHHAEVHDAAGADHNFPGGTTNFLRADGTFAAPPGGGSGDVATDTIWDAKGDLAAGTGADTAARLAVGTDGHVLTADSGQTTGLKWAAASGGGGSSPSRLAYDDVCDASSLPTDCASTGQLSFDSTRLRRELGGTSASTYVTASLPLNGPLVAEVVHENLAAPSTGDFFIELIRDSDSAVIARAAYQSDENMVVYVAGSAKSASGNSDLHEESFRTSLALNEQKMASISMTQNPGGGVWGPGQNGARTSYAGARYIYGGTLNASDDVHIKISTSSTRKVAIYQVRIWRGAITP